MADEPRYIHPLLRHLQEMELEPGQVHHIEVRHDDGCQVWDGKPCDCEPVVESGDRVDRKYSGDDQDGGS